MSDINTRKRVNEDESSESLPPKRFKGYGNFKIYSLIQLIMLI